jgi:AraC-like DNA-binding protein
MTQNVATTSSPDHAALHNLFVQVSGLLENFAEPAEVRVRRAGALLRDYPLRRFPASDPCLARPVASARGGGLPLWQIRKLTEYIENHIESTISIQDLAGIVRLSPSHFCRAFRRSTNDSPHCFVMRRRIARSQELMTTTRARLANIALDCGFADQAHFCRVYRKLEGEAPGIWRKMRQESRLLGD